MPLAVPHSRRDTLTLIVQKLTRSQNLNGDHLGNATLLLICGLGELTMSQRFISETNITIRRDVSVVASTRKNDRRRKEQNARVADDTHWLDEQ